MKNIFFCFLFFFLSIGYCYSQFESQMSQYMLHNVAYNSAAVGDAEMIQVVAQQRFQWMGMPGAPTTTFFSLNAPIKFNKNSLGIGIKFLNDKFGGFSNKSVAFQLAYKKQLEVGVLSIGLDVGFENIIIDGLRLKNDSGLIGEYHNIAQDKNIPTALVSGTTLDVGVGAMFTSQKMYAGLSYLHLNKPSATVGNSTFIQRGVLYFTGGYNYYIPDTKLVLKPSALFKSDFSSYQYDLTTRIEYNNKFWGGLTYRLEDAVVFLFGVNTNMGLSLGFSYDLPVSNIIKVSAGSFEVLGIYSFEYGLKNRLSKYKSVRIL